MEKQTDIDLHYRSVMEKLPSGNVTLDKVYETISDVNSNVDKYVKQWLHYQFLWDMQSGINLKKKSNKIKKNNLKQISKKVKKYE